MGQRLKYKTWNHRIPRRKHKEEAPHHLPWQWFYRREIKSTKKAGGRINKWDYIKLNSYCTAKITKATYRKKIFQSMYQIRGSFPKFIKNSYNLITIFFKWAQELNTHFSKENICGQRYKRRGSALLIIREIQIKNTMGYHTKPLKMVIIKTYKR